MPIFIPRLPTLAEARTRRGLSVEQLAECARISRRVIRYIEATGQEPYQQTRVALATALSVPVDAIAWHHLAPASPPHPRGR